ncbi:class I SAM-dependent methyltransferase [Roseinatronobacter alkalisoli]|uniref:Methyltransferase domain-containing protein n=1 Tax=Roseinatronobacter alkalisoli TaxID=3028235 RepID=A0ABT5TB20_9RHOB|nr:class I SAM-dependent methyltransferase [Roseinatronobacter sp. HJB301]MDD7972279.1 methyltransferase domain-containing protein [Roseinatronobacter sp. HJB301]
MGMKPAPTTEPGAAADYAERVARHVPGLHDLHRMTALLLAERVPDSVQVLVLGAGGGMELRAFAAAQPGWRFDGVDPSPDMITQARDILGPDGGRVTFHQGYIDTAPDGPFDGATCLLTLHFLPREERLRTLRALHRRLRPGAPFVMAHHSFPLEGGQQDLWLMRNAAWLISGGMSEVQAMAGMTTMKERLPVLPPEEDVALVRAAGFSDVQLFYAAFTFKGWIACA